MEPTLLSQVLLGLIAAATILQAALLLSFAQKSREVAARLERLEEELMPRVRKIDGVLEDLGQLTEAVLRRYPEVESTLDEAMRRVRRTTGIVETLVVKPLLPLVSVMALWKGLKRGAAVFRAHPVRS
jgi:hypothetical protein